MASLCPVEFRETAPSPEITVGSFVENVFVPEHVAAKTHAGRTHYRAILKHVVAPEEVDRIFDQDLKNSKSKLEAVPGWPYLSRMRLCDVRPYDVQQLISAALAHGYSTQTVKHIRNVVRSLFAHARKEQWFSGENPADMAILPRMTRMETHTLTPAEARRVLAAMEYPEKEMALIAILTGMNMEEICGLQWNCVNLTETWFIADGKPIPPRSIAVRKQWRCGRLKAVSLEGRTRNIPIPAPLFPILLRLVRRSVHTGPDDFVIVSPTGRPFDHRNIAVRRLKLIGARLQMPWLSWRVIRRMRLNLPVIFGSSSPVECSACTIACRPLLLGIGFIPDQVVR